MILDRIDRYLRRWGLDQDRLTRPPAAVRFEAERGNALWQLDLSPSDLKQVEAPSWAEPGRRRHEPAALRIARCQPVEPPPEVDQHLGGDPPSHRPRPGSCRGSAWRCP